MLFLLLLLVLLCPPPPTHTHTILPSAYEYGTGTVVFTTAARRPLRRRNPRTLPPNPTKPPRTLLSLSLRAPRSRRRAAGAGQLSLAPPDDNWDTFSYYARSRAQCLLAG